MSPKFDTNDRKNSFVMWKTYCIVQRADLKYNKTKKLARYLAYFYWLLSGLCLPSYGMFSFGSQFLLLAGNS
jgi:hypothetical protein